MKRFFIYLFLLLFFSFLIADNELDLGDFLIEGEGKNLPDSLHQANLADSLSTVNQINSFEYINEPVILELGEAKILEKYSHNVVQILGGDQELGTFALTSTNRITDWKNFGVKGYYQNRDKDWDKFSLELNWKPQILNHKLWITPHYLDVQSVPGDTKAWGSSLLLEPITFREGLLTYYALELGVNDLEQQVQDATDYDVEAYTLFNLSGYNLAMKFQMLKQTPSGLISLTRSAQGLPFLEQIGVWISADTLHFHPSISFFGSLDLSERMRLYWEQLPEISSNSRFDEIYSNPYQKIISSRLQTKKILNMNIRLSYLNILNFKLNYNPVWARDYQVFHYERGKLLSSEREDIFQHNFSIAFGKSFGSISVSSNNTFTIFDKEIPYERSFESKTSLSYQNNPAWNSRIEFLYESGSEDEKGDTMEVKTELNLDLNLRILQDLWITLRGNNLLDSPWKEYPGLPDNRINFQGGLRYYF